MSQVLDSIIDSLNDSTETEWSRAGLSDWSQWACRMRDVIRTSTPILKTVNAKMIEMNQDNQKLKEDRDRLENSNIEKDKLIAELVSKLAKLS